jgi:hypothetical protein
MSKFCSLRLRVLFVASFFCAAVGLDVRPRNHRVKGLLPISRNDFLWTAMGSASFAVFPLPSRAAAPITERETDSLAVMAKRALRPKPPKLLRRKLSQDFAVLLMRSSYNALDQLDCVAMVSQLSRYDQQALHILESNHQIPLYSWRDGSH